MDRTSPTGSSGLTLLELLIVLILLGAITMLISFGMERPYSIRLVTSTTSNAAALIQQTRNAAIVRNETQQLLIRSESIRAEGLGSVETAPGITIHIANELSEPAHHGIWLFFPDGSSTATTLIIGSQHHQRLLTVSQITGRIEIQP